MSYAIPHSPVLFTQAQAARYLGLSRWTFGELVDRGLVPQVLLGPRARPRYRIVDLDELIERSLVVAKEKTP